MRSYDELVRACDSDIRLGRPQDVARRLAAIEPSRVPRNWRLPLAKICRRAGLYSRGLSMLSRIVIGPRARSSIEAAPAEVAEYAALLIRCGAISEAERFLNDIDANAAPDAHLYRSYAHFLRWEYPEAVPRLELYLKSELSPYSRLVGQINLAYALLESRKHESAIDLLGELIEKTREGGHVLLESHCRAYRAQVFFNQGDFTQARAELKEAQKHFHLAQTSDHMIILKWDLILSGITSKSLEPFERLRQMAIQHHNWEALRDADLYSLRVKFDQERFLHLYFGTPFPRFRDLIRSELGVEANRELYVLGPKRAPRLDIRTGEIDDLPALRPGSKNHQLIEVLLRDFYEPLRVSAIFSALFPEEHFNISTSPDRVRKIVRRTRRWLKSQRIPVSIKAVDGFYSLVIEGNFSFRVPLDRRAADPAVLQFEKLRKIYDRTTSFSAKQARDDLGLSKSTVQRFLDWAIRNRKIERLGSSNRDASYRIAPIRD